jgi:serine/tyrosine/threonine adenylyltransferase
MTTTEIDMTLWYRCLIGVPIADSASDHELLSAMQPALYDPGPNGDSVTIHSAPGQAMVTWLRAWAQRSRAHDNDSTARLAVMTSLNPRFVLRNWLAHEAIELAEQGDFSRVHQLAAVLTNPYDEQPGQEHFAARRPLWALNQAGCSMLSCSS